MQRGLTEQLNVTLFLHVASSGSKLPEVQAAVETAGDASQFLEEMSRAADG